MQAIKGYIMVNGVMIPNSVLNSGKQFIVQSLVGNKEIIYVSHMIFGNGGYVNGVKRDVDIAQNRLFNDIGLKKKVVGQRDPQNPNQAIFTAILDYADANDVQITEMGLVLSNGELFSMSTFAPLTKSADDALTLDWYICY